MDMNDMEIPPPPPKEMNVKMDDDTKRRNRLMYGLSVDDDDDDEEDNDDDDNDNKEEDNDNDEDDTNAENVTNNDITSYLTNDSDSDSDYTSDYDGLDDDGYSDTEDENNYNMQEDDDDIDDNNRHVPKMEMTRITGGYTPSGATTTTTTITKSSLPAKYSSSSLNNNNRNIPDSNVFHNLSNHSGHSTSTGNHSSSSGHNPNNNGNGDNHEMETTISSSKNDESFLYEDVQPPPPIPTRNPRRPTSYRPRDLLFLVAFLVIVPASFWMPFVFSTVPTVTKMMDTTTMTSPTTSSTVGVPSLNPSVIVSVDNQTVLDNNTNTIHNNSTNNITNGNEKNNNILRYTRRTPHASYVILNPSTSLRWNLIVQSTPYTNATIVALTIVTIFVLLLLLPTPSFLRSFTQLRRSSIYAFCCTICGGGGVCCNNNEYLPGGESSSIPYQGLYNTQAGGDGEDIRRYSTNLLITSQPLALILIYPITVLFLCTQTPSMVGWNQWPCIIVFLRFVYDARTFGILFDWSGRLRWRRRRNNNRNYDTSQNGGGGWGGFGPISNDTTDNNTEDNSGTMNASARVNFFHEVAGTALDLLSRSLRRRSIHRFIISSVMIRYVLIMFWVLVVVRRALEGAFIDDTIRDSNDGSTANTNDNNNQQHSTRSMKDGMMLILVLIGGPWLINTVRIIIGYVCAGGIISWFAQQSIMLEKIECGNRHNNNSAGENRNDLRNDESKDDDDDDYDEDDTMPAAYRAADASTYAPVVDFDEGMDEDCFEDENDNINNNSHNNNNSKNNNGGRNNSGNGGGGNNNNNNRRDGNNGTKTFDRNNGGGGGRNNSRGNSNSNNMNSHSNTSSSAIGWTGGGSMKPGRTSGGSIVGSFLIRGAFTVSSGSVVACALLGWLSGFVHTILRTINRIVDCVRTFTTSSSRRNHRVNGGGGGGVGGGRWSEDGDEGFQGMAIDRFDDDGDATDSGDGSQRRSRPRGWKGCCIQTFDFVLLSLRMFVRDRTELSIGRCAAYYSGYRMAAREVMVSIEGSGRFH